MTAINIQTQKTTEGKGLWRLPIDWKWIPLEKFVEIHDEPRKPVKKADRIAGNIPYCGANGIIDYVEGSTHDGDFVMLAEDGGSYSAGEQSAYRMIGKFWANNHVHILLARKGKLINGWLLHCLNTLDLKNYLTGATRPKLNQTAMRRIPLPVPASIKTQEAIVSRIESLLSEIKEARKLLDKMRKDAERVLNGALDEIFAFSDPSWIETELGNLIKLKSGEFLRSKDMQAGGKHPVYGGNGLAGYHDDYLFENSKVIIGRVGAKCGCIHISEPKSWITDNALYVHEKLTPLDDAYLAYLLSAAKLNQYASRAAQPVISGRTIYPVKLKYTNDLNQQKAIVIHLDNIRNEMANINATIEKSSNLVDELEQSVLNRAFRGDSEKWFLLEKY